MSQSTLPDTLDTPRGIPEFVHQEGNSASTEVTQKVMILMRGLPSCGKSHTSGRLASTGGVRLEFDAYFYTEVGGNPTDYDWSDELMPDARRWNLDRIRQAVDTGVSPIIVDSDNNVGSYTREYVAYAVNRGYEIQFKEPDSGWWRTIRKLLQDKEANEQALRLWAKQLAKMSRKTHRVSMRNFLHRIDQWEEITVDRVLANK